MDSILIIGTLFFLCIGVFLWLGWCEAGDREWTGRRRS